MNSDPGTYVLILRTRKNATLDVGKWGKLAVQAGYYAYVGSAFGPGGVKARVSRHCRLAKKKHWHIDYLLERALSVSVWYNHSSSRLEHAWAGVISGFSEARPVPGFGCSDCGCESHLFYFSRKPELTEFREKTRAVVQSWRCDGRIQRGSRAGV